MKRHMNLVPDYRRCDKGCCEENPNFVTLKNNEPFFGPPILLGVTAGASGISIVFADGQTGDEPDAVVIPWDELDKFRDYVFPTPTPIPEAFLRD